MPNILVVEDHPDVADLVALHLRNAGFEVDVAPDGRAGLDLALRAEHDLLILDVMLPGVDGLEICRKIRARARYTPIVILTAKSAEFDRVLGLELGADDYVTKPFSVRELVARVKALLRRAEAMASPPSSLGPISVGPFTLDPTRRRAIAHGRDLELTAREFELLQCFMENPGRVFTRTQLLDEVWGYGHQGYEHTVNTHINRLRRKVETDPSQPQFVLTVWGVGYKFFEPGAE